jgi:hypothetical protein
MKYSISLDRKEMQLKLRFHVSPIRQVIIRKTMTNESQDTGKGNFIHVEM